MIKQWPNKSEIPFINSRQKWRCNESVKAGALLLSHLINICELLNKATALEIGIFGFGQKNSIHFGNSGDYYRPSTNAII